MPKKMISKGIFSNLPGLCYGEGSPQFEEKYNVIFDVFFAEGDRPLQYAIDVDLSPYGIPDNFLLWTLCRASVVDSFVLRQFASDCIEFAGSVLVPDEGLLAECVTCARDYAVGDCDYDMLMATKQLAVDRMFVPETPENVTHFFNVVQHVLSSHPDAGALQCVMNLPRSFDQQGEDSGVLGAWMKAAFWRRCQEAGFFDEG